MRSEGGDPISSQIITDFPPETSFRLLQYTSTSRDDGRGRRPHFRPLTHYSVTFYSRSQRVWKRRGLKFSTLGQFPAVVGPRVPLLADRPPSPHTRPVGSSPCPENFSSTCIPSVSNTLPRNSTERQRDFTYGSHQPTESQVDLFVKDSWKSFDDCYYSTGGGTGVEVACTVVPRSVYGTDVCRLRLGGPKRFLDRHHDPTLPPPP